MNTIYDGLLFDVDGTIWDSTPVVEKAWNAALADSGHGDVSITADRLKGLFGLPMVDIIEDILPESTPEEKEFFLPLCSRYEFEYLEKESGVVYEGLEDALRTLSGSGIPLFIVSNCQSGYIELMYRKTGFGNYFQDQLCPGDTGKLKADNILIMAQRHKLKRPAYIGDTAMDMEACRKAGVPFIYAAYGFGRVTGPDGIIKDPRDLIALAEGR